MNQPKAENAALIITTFVQNRSGFQKDGTPDNELGNGWGCYDLGLQNENLVLKAWESLLSRVMATDAKLKGFLSSVPEKITSCIFPPRNCLALCSPRTQRTASPTLLFPLPFGPTMPVIPL